MATKLPKKLILKGKAKAKRAEARTQASVARVKAALKRGQKSAREQSKLIRTLLTGGRNVSDQDARRLRRKLNTIRKGK